MQAPRMCLILSENWTMTCGRDLPRLVRWAREAEDAGFDAVMLSEHIVLGPASGAGGIMGNPRDYAAPGNQDPATPWPDSIVLMSAIAAAERTTPNRSILMPGWRWIGARRKLSTNTTTAKTTISPYE